MTTYFSVNFPRKVSSCFSNKFGAGMPGILPPFIIPLRENRTCGDPGPGRQIALFSRLPSFFDPGRILIAMAR
jgi:hypothetical protein